MFWKWRFLYILIIKSQNSFTFKVDCKPTNRNDYIHFYSHHYNKIKTGLIIGFYLRALRIYRPQYLNEEFKYKSLKYPKFFILDARKKALKIHSSNKPKKTNPNISITHRPISLPTNTHNITLYDKLNKLGIPIIQTTSQTIKNITNITKRTNNETTSHAGIYSIPCKDCNKHYIGETQRNLKKRIHKPKRSIKTNDDRNDLFSHMLVLKHIFDFSQTTQIKPIHCKTPRRLLESAVISNKTYKTTTRFLLNLIISGQYHTEWKQSQNRKRIGKNFFSLCATILLKILFAFPGHLPLSPSSP